MLHRDGKDSETSRTRIVRRTATVTHRTTGRAAPQQNRGSSRPQNRMRGGVVQTISNVTRQTEPKVAAKLKMLTSAIRTLDTRAIKVAPKVADAELQTSEYRRWRDEVYRRAGYRCQAVDDGRRCAKAAPMHRMFADHIVERSDGGALLDPANGQCLCGSHHTTKTIAARARRMSQRS